MGDNHVGSIFGHGFSFIDSKGITRRKVAGQVQKEPIRTSLQQRWPL
jgi:hypothetical protein